MRLHQSSTAGGANRFHTTRWSVVLLSAQTQFMPGFDLELPLVCAKRFVASQNFLPTQNSEEPLLNDPFRGINGFL
jgi:hypothetical protein